MSLIRLCASRAKTQAKAIRGQIEWNANLLTLQTSANSYVQTTRTSSVEPTQPSYAWFRWAPLSQTKNSPGRKTINPLHSKELVSCSIKLRGLTLQNPKFSSILLRNEKRTLITPRCRITYQHSHIITKPHLAPSSSPRTSSWVFQAFLVDAAQTALLCRSRRKPSRTLRWVGSNQPLIGKSGSNLNHLAEPKKMSVLINPRLRLRKMISHVWPPLSNSTTTQWRIYSIK